MEIKIVLWMFFFGGSAAIISMYYNSRFLGNMVRSLLKIDATSPETAITADELGIKITPALKHALRPESNFSQIVMKTDDERYFVAADKIAMAKAKYKAKSISLGFVITSIIILFVVTCAMVIVMPDVINGFSDSFSGIFNEGK